MAKTETMSARSPRGTRPVSEAFFAALAGVPAASRAVVAKAAQAMIRDELKVQRDRAKATGAKQKAAKPMAAKASASATKPATTARPAAKAPTKTRALAKKPGVPALKAKAAKPAGAEKTAETSPAT